MSSREIQRGDQRNTPTSFSLHAPISFWFLLLAIPTKSWKAIEPGLDNTWRSMSWHTEQDIAGEWNLRQSENIQERKHTTNSHTPSSKSYQWSHWLRKDKVRSLPQNIFFAMTEPTHKKILFPPHEKHLVLLSSFVPRALLNLADWRADLKSNPQWHLLFFSKLPRSGL